MRVSQDRLPWITALVLATAGTLGAPAGLAQQAGKTGTAGGQPSSHYAVAAPGTR